MGVKIIFPKRIKPLLKEIRIFLLPVLKLQKFLLFCLEFLKPHLGFSPVQLDRLAPETVASEFFRINIGNRHIAAKFSFF